jgi:aryl-alcohol dehydrogenase-like predicted oxidoreductase
LKAVEELKRLVPKGATISQFALRWILMFDAITCAIPGAKRPEQAAQNVAASSLPRLSRTTMLKIEAIYNNYIRPQVHHRW